jgi:hypothetical protein
VNAFLWTPLRHPLRWPLAIFAAIGAGAHLPVVGEHLREAPYMGEEFIVLIVACLLIAVAALVCDSAALYAIAAGTCGLAIAGYALTRLVALPQLADDVGNWLEPLGVASLLAETATVAVALFALADRRRASRG